MSKPQRWCNNSILLHMLAVITVASQEQQHPLPNDFHSLVLGTNVAITSLSTKNVERNHQTSCGDFKMKRNALSLAVIATLIHVSVGCGNDNAQKHSENNASAETSTMEMDEGMNLLTPGCHLTVIEIARFHGRVTSSLTGTAIANPKISVFSSRYGLSTRTGETNGRFQIVPSITYCKISDWAWVCAEATGFVGQCSRVNAGLLPNVEVNLNLNPRTAATPSGSCKADVSFEFQSAQGGCQNLLSLTVFSRPTSATMTWDAANSLCSNLSESGFTDWRLPTRSELTSSGGSQAQVVYGFETKVSLWTSDETSFDRRTQRFKSANVANIATKKTSSKAKTSKYKALCVRDGGL